MQADCAYARQQQLGQQQQYQQLHFPNFFQLSISSSYSLSPSLAAAVVSQKPCVRQPSRRSGIGSPHSVHDVTTVALLPSRRRTKHVACLNTCAAAVADAAATALSYCSLACAVSDVDGRQIIIQFCLSVCSSIRHLAQLQQSASCGVHSTVCTPVGPPVRRCTLVLTASSSASTARLDRLQSRRHRPTETPPPVDRFETTVRRPRARARRCDQVSSVV